MVYDWSDEKTKLIGSKGSKDYIPRSYIIDQETKVKTMITKKRFIVGRGDACDMTVFDESISRIHCCIVDTENSFILEDLDSSNGTFVNDVKIKKIILKDADLFKMGNRDFSFHFLNLNG